MRREISRWKLKSGAGGAYSTGAVETRVRKKEEDDGDEGKEEREEEREEERGRRGRGRGLLRWREWKEK